MGYFVMLFLNSLEKFRVLIQEKCIPFEALSKHFLIIPLAAALYGKKIQPLDITDIYYQHSHIGKIPNYILKIVFNLSSSACYSLRKILQNKNLELLIHLYT